MKTNYKLNTQHNIIKKKPKRITKKIPISDDTIFEDYEKQHKSIHIKEELPNDKKSRNHFGTLIFGLIISFIGIAILIIIFKKRRNSRDFILPLTFSSENDYKNL